MERRHAGLQDVHTKRDHLQRSDCRGDYAVASLRRIDVC